MLQNPYKTLGIKKNMVHKIPGGGGGGVNHIQPVAYYLRFHQSFWANHSTFNIYRSVTSWLSLSSFSNIVPVECSVPPFRYIQSRCLRPLLSSVDNLCKRRTDILSVLIWVESVWHPETVIFPIPSHLSWMWFPNIRLRANKISVLLL